MTYLSYWQRGADDAHAHRPPCEPVPGGEHVRANRSYRNGYLHVVRTRELAPGLARDPALQAALDAFTWARARGTSTQALQARAELLRLLGAEDAGPLERLSEALRARLERARSRGDVADERVVRSMQEMLRRAK